jgi:hypothetical protein
MRRNVLSGAVAAAILVAGPVWAAPNTGASAAQFLNQINVQTNRIQTHADRLEAYVRSGARDWNNSAAYAFDMAEEAQKLSTLLDLVAAQPGASNDTRRQVQKMKSMTDELMAFAGDTLGDLDSHTIALHRNNVFANTANIEVRCSMIRSAAQALLIAR